MYLCHCSSKRMMTAKYRIFICYTAPNTAQASYTNISHSFPCHTETRMLTKTWILKCHYHLLSRKTVIFLVLQTFFRSSHEFSFIVCGFINVCHLGKMHLCLTASALSPALGVRGWVTTCVTQVWLCHSLASCETTSRERVPI